MPEIRGVTPTFKEKVGVVGVERENEGEEAETEEPDGNILDELFVPISEYRGGFDWDFGKLVCIIAMGDGEDGKGTFEEILARKYGYHGNFTFERDPDFPGTIVKNIDGVVISKLHLRDENESQIVAKDILERIADNKTLIISSTLKESDLENLEVVINTLSDRAYGKDKCVVLYADEKVIDHAALLPICSRIDKIPNATVSAIKLPKLDLRSLKHIGIILGVYARRLGVPTAVDDAYALAWRRYEALKEDLCEKANRELRLEKGGPLRYFFLERESKLHYEMKKIVCWCLQKQYPNKKVEMEEDIIPDINACIK